MRWMIAGCCMIAGLWIAGPAHAGIVDFILSKCAQAGLPLNCNNSDSGKSVLDFIQSGLDLNVKGFVGAVPNNFDLRLGTPDETGLGLFGATPANEVGPGDSEVFNLTALAKAGITSGTATISSLQNGEVGLLTDINGPHVVSEVDGTGVGSVPFTFSLANPIVTLTANAGDVLAAADVEVTASVPEPAPWLLMGTAFLGFGLGWRRLRAPRHNPSP